MGHPEPKFLPGADVVQAAGVAQAVDEAHDVGHRIRSELFHDAATLSFDGPLGRAEFKGDLLIQHALREEQANLALPRGELLEEIAILLQGIVRGVRCIRAIERGLDCSQQFLALKRLGEEVHRPSLHCFDRGGYIALSADKHDGETRLVIGYDLLEFQTGHFGHVQVEQQACRSGGNARAQKLRSRGIDLYVVVVRSQQTRDAAEQVRIIIDDVDGASCGFGGFHNYNDTPRLDGVEPAMVLGGWMRSGLVQ